MNGVKFRRLRKTYPLAVCCQRNLTQEQLVLRERLSKSVNLSLNKTKTKTKPKKQKTKNSHVKFDVWITASQAYKLYLPSTIFSPSLSLF